MQNLEPILIFITVAEMGSFTRAADSLGIQKGRASTAVGSWKKMSVSGFCTGRRAACS
jgi:DNA-binding transcriptional LysR family regulator